MVLKKIVVLVGLIALIPWLSFAETPGETNAKVNAALARFHKEVRGADHLLADAQGGFGAS